MSFEDYAESQGFNRQMPFATFTRTTINMSGAALRRAKAQHERDLNRWQAGRDKARREYARLVKSGRILPPTRIQKLIQRARGHSDRSSVQAARRLLKKQGLSW
jgi:hypothetical protein